MFVVEIRGLLIFCLYYKLCREFSTNISNSNGAAQIIATKLLLAQQVQTVLQKKNVHKKS